MTTEDGGQVGTDMQIAMNIGDGVCLNTSQDNMEDDGDVVDGGVTAMDDGGGGVVDGRITTMVDGTLLEDVQKNVLLGHQIVRTSTGPLLIKAGSLLNNAKVFIFHLSITISFIFHVTLEFSCFSSLT